MPFDSARVKLDRADEHLEALEKEIADFGDEIARRYTDTLKIKVGRQDDWYILVIAPFPETFPARWGALAGDMIQNTRSALDHAVSELVSAGGQEPTRWHQFPIYTDDNGWKGDVLRKDRPERSSLYGIAVDSPAWAVIERVQPFHTDNPTSNRLSLLRRLSNRDKHRALVVQMAFHSVESIERMVGWNPSAVLIEKHINSVPLPSDGYAEIARYRFERPDEASMHMDKALPVDPTFGDEEVQAGTGVFRAVIKHARDIVNRLEEVMPQ